MDESESCMPTLKASTMKSLLDLLECPICMDAMYPPIYQCANGHSFCSDCKSKINRCPSCQGQTIDIRSLPLEKLTEFFEYPCKYYGMGCRETHELASKRQHEDHCKFRPYQCPHAVDCNFKGNVLLLVRHLKDIHRCHCYNLTQSFLRTPPMEGNEVTSAVYNDSGNHFFVSLESIDSGKYKDDCLVSIAFMGESEEAKKFRCKLEIGNDEHKLIWEGAPLSIRLGRKEQNESLVGLMIPDCFFVRFDIGSPSGSLCFHFKGQIWKYGLAGDYRYDFDFWAQRQIRRSAESSLADHYYHIPVLVEDLPEVSYSPRRETASIDDTLRSLPDREVEYLMLRTNPFISAIRQDVGRRVPPSDGVPPRRPFSRDRQRR